MDLAEKRRLLHEELQKSGIANQIKAKMRSEILQELKKRHEDALFNGRRPENGKVSVVDQMIAQYFQRHGYHYTLSIYSAESGVENAKVLTPLETLRVLGLNGWPRFVQAVSDTLTQNPTQGFLIVLLESMGLFLNSVPEQSNRQRQGEKKKNEDSDSYLKRLEENYADATKAFQKEVLEIKKHNEKTIEEEVQKRMKQFRSQEAVDIKAKEESYWQRQMQYHKDHLEDSFQKRILALSEREQYLTENLNRERAEVERKFEECKQKMHHDEMVLRSKREDLERCFAERQAHMEHLELHCRQREQALVRIEHELQQKLIGWTNKEKHYEAQAHFKAQQNLLTENEKLTQQKVKIQEEWLKLQQEKHHFIKQQEQQNQKMKSMEEDLKVSEEKAFQLKENEEILLSQIQRLQSELLEFQSAFLQAHDIPLDRQLLPNSQDRGLSRSEIVHQLISRVNKSQALCKEWEAKARSIKDHKVQIKRDRDNALNVVKEWKHRCKRVEKVAREAIKDTENLCARYFESKRRCRAYEQECKSHELRMQQLQEEVLRKETSRQENSQKTVQQDSSVVDRRTKQAAFEQLGQVIDDVVSTQNTRKPCSLAFNCANLLDSLDNSGYSNLEAEEEQLQRRVRDFRQNLRTLLTHSTLSRRSRNNKKSDFHCAEPKSFLLTQYPQVELSAGDSELNCSRDNFTSGSESSRSSFTSESQSTSDKESSCHLEHVQITTEEEEIIKKNAEQLLCLVKSDPKTASESEEATVALLSPRSDKHQLVFAPNPVSPVYSTQEHSGPAACSLSNMLAFSLNTQSTMDAIGTTDSIGVGLGSTVEPVPSTCTIVPVLPVPQQFAALFSSASPEVSNPQEAQPLPALSMPQLPPWIQETTLANPIHEIQSEPEKHTELEEIQNQKDAEIESSVDKDSLPSTTYEDDFDQGTEVQMLCEIKEQDENLEGYIVGDNAKTENENEETESSLPAELEGLSDTSI